MKIFDSHLHMGYLSKSQIVEPSEVCDFIRKHNVCGGVIMPTANIGGYDDLEFHQDLYKRASSLGFGILLYVNRQVLSMLINGCFSVNGFCGMKVHPDAVSYTDEEIEKIASIAASYGLPLLIHTGSKESCHSSRFENIIRKFSKQIFVLCHARPADEAFYLMMKYENVWIDTSFLPIEELRKNISNDVVDRILFGSDFPANRWYNEIVNEDIWYENEIECIKSSFTSIDANKILHLNYNKLFNKT